MTAPCKPIATSAAGFTLSTEQYARLAKQSPADRRYDLGRLLYAQLYREWCRERRVAVLNHWTEMTLQARWQTEREALIDAVDGVFFAAQMAEAA